MFIRVTWLRLSPLGLSTSCHLRPLKKHSGSLLFFLRVVSADPFIIYARSLCRVDLNVSCMKEACLTIFFFTLSLSLSFKIHLNPPPTSTLLNYSSPSLAHSPFPPSPYIPYYFSFLFYHLRTPSHLLPHSSSFHLKLPLSHLLFRLRLTHLG